MAMPNCVIVEFVQTTRLLCSLSRADQQNVSRQIVKWPSRPHVLMPSRPHVMAAGIFRLTGSQGCSTHLRSSRLGAHP